MPPMSATERSARRRHNEREEIAELRRALIAAIEELPSSKFAPIHRRFGPVIARAYAADRSSPNAQTA
jgi:hypothetical protein